MAVSCRMRTAHSGRLLAAAAAFWAQVSADRGSCLEQYVPVDCGVAPGSLVQRGQGHISAPEARLTEALPIHPLLPCAGGCAQVPACG